jgi:dTDP-4-amino-4,6-dideoxygalactose transaminase
MKGAGVQASKELTWMCPDTEQHQFPNAANLIDTTLSLPFHPLTNAADIDSISAALTSTRAL